MIIILYNKIYFWICKHFKQFSKRVEDSLQLLVDEYNEARVQKGKQ
jgi:hypothetical protein